MGRRGKESVVTQFSKESMAERLENEFDTPAVHDRLGAVTPLLLLSAIVVLVLSLGVAICLHV